MLDPRGALKNRGAAPSGPGMEKVREGGCACGTVRYRLLSTPFDTGWCRRVACVSREASCAVGIAGLGPELRWKLVRYCVPGIKLGIVSPELQAAEPPSL